MIYSFRCCHACVGVLSSLVGNEVSWSLLRQSGTPPHLEHKINRVFVALDCNSNRPVVTNFESKSDSDWTVVCCCAHVVIMITPHTVSCARGGGGSGGDVCQWGVWTAVLLKTRHLGYLQLFYDRRTQQRVVAHQVHRWLHQPDLYSAKHNTRDAPLPLLLLCREASLAIPGASGQPRQSCMQKVRDSVSGVFANSVRDSVRGVFASAVVRGQMTCEDYSHQQLCAS